MPTGLRAALWGEPGGLPGAAGPSHAAWRRHGPASFAFSSLEPPSDGGAAAGSRGGGEAGQPAGNNGTAGLAALQREIDTLSKEWQSGLDSMEGMYGKAQGAQKQAAALWKKDRAPLEAACERLRDALDRLTEVKGVCEEAQGDESSGLPALFRKRAADPERFKRFNGGAVKGCVGPPSEGSGDPVEAPCTCPTGNEAVGCRDATDPSSHRLLCTYLVETAVPKLKVAEYFQDKGLCSISNSDALTKPIIPPETFTNLAKARVPASLLALAAAQPPSRAHARRRRERREALERFWARAPR